MLLSPCKPSIRANGGLINCGQGKPERSCVEPFRLLVWRRCPPVPEQISRTVETLYRSESGRVLHIARVEGRLKMAEEAYEAALRQALEELTEVHQDAFSFV